uniref:Uncharacterized protein n=1 Tax=Erwinia amylovora ATCC BAA-2158 TaxID=889211 RepID=E5B5Y5_ERWAM|nr:hypothetical protein predicted by Glimmer/Critica [Erwinia amylovora ATCC BAA-2158]
MQLIALKTLKRQTVERQLTLQSAVTVCIGPQIFLKQMSWQRL